MSAAAKSAIYTSAAGDWSPAVVNCPRGEQPRATGTSVSTAAGNMSRNQDESVIELIHSGESNDASDSKATPRASGSPGANSARSMLTGSGHRGGVMSKTFGSSDGSEESPPHASPSNDRRVGVALMHLYITTSEVTREIEVSLVSVLVLAPIKRPGTEMSCATILKWSLLGCLHPDS
uniref:Uncharacterized protein n=1 Tax=Peronospora matthiolae TaxID=2874970 RepID=A0AAV1TBC5_9STRA